MRNSKIVSRLIVLSVCFLSVLFFDPLSTRVANASDRYTALVLDLSGSMNGTPIQELRKASKNFCNKLLATGGNNYIAIIGFGSYADIDSPFSNNSLDLELAIDTMSDGGMTNVVAGINAAGGLFASPDIPGDAIRNIIVMSDGMPNIPSSETEAIVAATEAAQALSDDGYNVYSLGFFHGLNDNTKNKAREFLEGLQNKGYHEVEDGDKLDFEFGNIADDIMEDNYPIIFIPGIMGSDLYRYQVSSGMEWFEFYDATVWLPTNAGTMWNGSNMSEFPLYVRLPEDQRKISEGNRYYGTINAYKQIIDRLCSDDLGGREVYFFAYDWRLGIEENANKLKEFADELAANKVDLVCHSMGGLLGSAYYNMESNKIDKIITIATPYEGSPKIFRIATSSFLNVDKDNPIELDLILGAITGGNIPPHFIDKLFTIVGGLSKNVKASYRGVAELAPSKNYVSELPMRQFVGSSLLHSAFPISYDKYREIHENIFGTENSKLSISFQESLNNSSGYNSLLSYDKSYFSIGIDQLTIVRVNFSKSGTDVPDIDIPLIGNIGLEDDIDYEKQGDGTVPYISGSIMEKIKTLSADRWIEIQADHSEIVKNENNIEWIIDILKKGSSDKKSDERNEKGFIVIRIACPVDAVISQDSETLTSTSAGYSDIASFGRMDIIGDNNDLKLFCVEEGNYPVNMKGTDSGKMDYSIRFFDEDGDLKDERKFLDVPITDQTVVTTDTSRDDSTTLYIDEDGDGIIDKELTASSNGTVDGSNNDNDNNNNDNNGNGDNNNDNDNNNGGNDGDKDEDEDGSLGSGGCSASNFGVILFAIAGAALLRKSARR